MMVNFLFVNVFIVFFQCFIPLIHLDQQVVITSYAPRPKLKGKSPFNILFFVVVCFFFFFFFFFFGIPPLGDFCFPPLVSKACAEVFPWAFPLKSSWAFAYSLFISFELNIYILESITSPFMVDSSLEFAFHQRSHGKYIFENLFI